MSVLKILQIRKIFIMRNIIRITSLLLCVLCITGCFRGVSEETEAISKSETSSEVTEEASSEDAASESTDAVSAAESESETFAQTIPESTEPVTEPETLPTPVETEPETLPTPVETEPETLPPSADNGNAPAPVEGQLTYIDGILVVNKTYPLPADYNPGVDATAYEALTDMFSAAAAEGLSLWVKSGFRSYNDQYWQYNYYAERDGVALADTYSARAGHSEHQSGLAFDLNSLYKSFGNTAEGQWLAANCYKYGFIIRYPEGKEHITGYMYEPWHVRYVGIDAATAMYTAGVCLEEYLGITSSYAE